MASDDPGEGRRGGQGSRRDVADSDGGWLRDPRIVVARRTLGSLRREKTIVLAVLIQLFVAAFSSFLVFGLSSMYDPGSVQAGELVVGISGDASDELEAAAAEVPGVVTTSFSTRDRARNAFDRRRVGALLHARYAEPGDGADGRVIRVGATAPEGSVRSTLVVVRLREVLEALERQERFDRAGHLENPPLRLPSTVDASQYFGFTYTVLVPLLLFLPAFISGSIVVDGVTEELERGTFELLRVAPVPVVALLDGKALATVALAPVQVLLWTLLLTFNGIPVANVPALLAFVTAVTTVVVALGVALGLRFGRRRSAQLAYSVLALVLFGVAIFLPEHPTTTAARLAVDSASTGTYGHVLFAVVLALGAAALTRRYVGDVDPESL